MFLPFLTVSMQDIPLDEKIDPSYFNGPIAAYGIFLGFLTATTISKSEYLENIHYALAYYNLFIFLGAIIKTFNSQLSNGPTVLDLSLIMASINVNGGTALLFINKLRRKNEVSCKEILWHTPGEPSHFRSG